MSCTARKLIEIALAEAGYLEKKSKSQLDSKTANAGSGNFTKYARDLDALKDFYNYPKQGYAWCDVFVDWCFFKAFGEEKALELTCQPKKSAGAGCTYSARYYKEKGQFHTESPQVGDQIFFTSGSGGVAHTGIVYDVDKTYVYTVEGNTSGASGVVANGGGVCKKKYKLSYSRIYGYGRPAYDAQPEEPAYQPTVKQWQKAAIADGFKFPKYGADGKWGAECEAVAKKAIVKRRVTYKYKNLTRIVQKVVGVNVDGKCGKDTQAGIKAYQQKTGLSPDSQCGPATWKQMLGV